MIDTKGVVGLKEERERIDAKKRKSPRIARNRKKLLQPVLLLHPALRGGARGGGIVIRKGPLSLLSNRRETEEEVVDEGGGECEIENENSFIDIDDILDPEGAPARRILRLEAIQRRPVVTRSGRVVKVGYLEK